MKAIVLAAGKGKRLLSENHDMPKVLREVNNYPLLHYVMENISFLDKRDTIVVVGYKKELVRQYFGNEYKYAVQDEQLGTGHAVSMAKEYFEKYNGPVLVCYGDMPLLKRSTFKELLKIHQKENNDCTVLTGISNKQYAYGRVVRDNKNNFLKVVEEKDCTKEQLDIHELNVGVYVFDSKKLFSVLGNLKNDNNQGEYYLTDVPQILIENGSKIGTYTIEDDNEILGVNTIEDLEYCENLLRGEI